MLGRHAGSVFDAASGLRIGVLREQAAGFWMQCCNGMVILLFWILEGRWHICSTAELEKQYSVKNGRCTDLAWRVQKARMAL